MITFLLRPLSTVLVPRDLLLQEAPGTTPALTILSPAHTCYSLGLVIAALSEWLDTPRLWMSAAHSGWQQFPGGQRTLPGSLPNRARYGAKHIVSAQETSVF